MASRSTVPGEGHNTTGEPLGLNEELADPAALGVSVSQPALLCSERPGQAMGVPVHGQLCRRMAEGGVNIEVLYGDHPNQLILVVDKLERRRRVSEAWKVPTPREGNSHWEGGQGPPDELAPRFGTLGRRGRSSR